MKQSNNNTNEDNFAQMFEQSLTSMESFKPGQMLDTTVLAIGKECIFLQLGGKSEGILDKDEVSDENGQVSVKPGDAIRVFFLQGKNGELHFTTKIGGEKAVPAMIEQAYRNRIPVDGVVEKEIKGGYEVKLGDTRAFCPFSQMGPRRSEDAAAWIGKTLPFIIQEYKESGRNILVSNRVIHEDAKQEKIETLKASLKVGDVVKGTIKSIQDYGAFVDIDGFQALLPVSEISRSRIEDIRAVFKPGQEIEAAILRLDWANEKISLSMKSLMKDPWDEVPVKYPEYSKHVGKVVRIADFGAFVNLEPGIDGLIPMSDLMVAGKYSSSKEISVKQGQILTVQITGVDRANRRISLKQAATAEEDAASAKYMGGANDGETYNPFAALLKKKS